LVAETSKRANSQSWGGNLLFSITTLEVAFTSARTTFEELPSGTLIMFGDRLTAYAPHPGLLMEGLKIYFTALFIRKMLHKIDQIHGFGYF